MWFVFQNLFKKSLFFVLPLLKFSRFAMHSRNINIAIHFKARPKTSVFYVVTHSNTYIFNAANSSVCLEYLINL